MALKNLMYYKDKDGNVKEVGARGLAAPPTPEKWEKVLDYIFDATEAREWSDQFNLRNIYIKVKFPEGLSASWHQISVYTVLAAQYYGGFPENDKVYMATSLEQDRGYWRFTGYPVSNNPDFFYAPAAPGYAAFPKDQTVGDAITGFGTSVFEAGTIIEVWGVK